MDRKKVFISSVMRGFDDERNAAASAVGWLRHDAVMAEKFGARASSPQAACLEGVDESDIYVGIFGERYGDSGKSGKSPTEEEYRRAEELGLPRLCLVTTGPKSAEQQQFIQSIRDYDDGVTYAPYSSVSEIYGLVVQAINDHLHITPKDQTNPESAELRLAEALHPDGNLGKDATVVSLAIMPERAKAEYLSPRHLGDPSFLDGLEKELLFGAEPRIFDKSRGVEHLDGEKHLVIFQADDRRPVRTVTLTADGVLTFGIKLETVRTRTAHGLSMAEHFVIDQNRVAETLEASLNFARHFYSSIDAFKGVSNFYFWSQLTNIGAKSFGILPNRAINGMSYPMHNMPDPIRSPDNPRLITSKDFRDIPAIAEDLVSRYSRKFKANNAHFNAG